MAGDQLLGKDDFRDLIYMTDDVFAKVEAYHALLLKWQKAINIVSNKTIDEAWHRHFIDSAQVSKFIPMTTSVYADLGCGGGFPGLVLAIIRSELEVHLVESDERKCQFMSAVVREAGLDNVTIHTKRIEDVTRDFEPDFITARALASLDELFAYCLPWASRNPSLEFCFMKGARAEEEIEEALQSYSFEYSLKKSITDPQARLALIKGLKQKSG